MRRRSLLRSVTLGGTALVAGCTGEPAPGTEDSPFPSDTPTVTTNPPTDSPADSTDSATASPTGSSSHGTDPERSFTVTNVECGTGGNDAEVTLDGTTILVRGSAGASDPCHSARLVEGRTTVTDGTLHVAVETYVPPGNEDEACVQCLADVEYEATFAFDGGRPDRVEVSHDGDVVAKMDV